MSPIFSFEILEQILYQLIVLLLIIYHSMVILQMLNAIMNSVRIDSKLVSHIFNELIRVHISNFLLLSVHWIRYGLKIIVKIFSIVLLDGTHRCVYRVHSILTVLAFHGRAVTREEVQLLVQMLLELFPNIVVGFKFFHISLLSQHLLDLFLYFWKLAHLVNIDSIFGVHPQHCFD